MNESSKKFILPLILFIFSYSLYSYNLDQQGIFIDEVFHHGFSIMYFDSLKNGDILNPCITGIGDCTMIVLECLGEMQSLTLGGPVKGIFVGLGDYWFSDAERVYYANQEPCRPIPRNQIIRGVNTPTQAELGAARFFAPIFGGMGVIVAFKIGSLLFNRFVGGIFATTLMFYSLFMLHARILTSEIFVSFFSLLAILLLLQAFFAKDKFQLKYVILSAITFALALNTKMLAAEILPFMILIIGLGFSKGRISLSSFRKIFSKKTLGIICVFLIVTVTTVISTFPYYYPDPISQILVQLDVASTYTSLNKPWSPTGTLPFISTFSATVLPTIDSYYYLFDSENVPESAQRGHTFTTIPLTLFSLVGISFVLQKIRRKNLTLQEFLMLAWYIPIFIYLGLSIDSYNQSRFFLPLMFPMILIMSYGLWRFCEKIVSNKIKIGFVSLTMISHGITYLIFWKRIYFEPSTIWVLPSYINLRNSLSDPIVFYISIVFLVAFLIVNIFRKRKISSWNLL